MAATTRLDPLLVAEAGLTRREVEALELWAADPRARSGGYRSVALALDISMSSARDRIQRGLRKLERHSRPVAA